MQTPSAGRVAAAMAGGGFLGGLISGHFYFGVFGFIGLSLAGSITAMCLVNPNWKSDLGNTIGTVLGLSTFVSLPCGFVGMVISK